MFKRVSPPVVPALWRTVVASGTVTGLLFATACASEDRAAPLPGVSGAERELSFMVNGDEVFATFTAPGRSTGTVPGALIISGSGPTDRDGNSDLRPNADTNLNFSRVLAEAGVASLRYDKLGSGETGMGERDPDAPIEFQVFDDQMIAAYEELVSRPEVDPERTVVIGHSEGALYALRAHELVGGSPALVLAAPPGTRYLDLIDRQLTERVRQDEALGQLNDTDSAQILSDARAGRAAVRGGRPLPDDLSPALAGVYSSQNASFLSWIDALDPVDLAEGLPDGTPVLVLWGEEDAQVSREDVDRLMTGFAGAERVDIPEADHIFRYFEDEPGATVLDSDRSFADEVSPALEGFLGTTW